MKFVKSASSIYLVGKSLFYLYREKYYHFVYSAILFKVNPDLNIY